MVCQLNFKIRLDAKSNVTLKFKKHLAKCFEMIFASLVRNAKATNVVQSNFNQD